MQDRIVDAHLYYFALMRAMARMAAGDALGVYDEHIAVFQGTLSAKPAADTKSRRELLARQTSMAIYSSSAESGLCVCKCGHP